MASLRISLPEQEAQLYLLRKQVTHIGRVPANEIALGDPHLGDIHLQIIDEGDAYCAVAPECGHEFFINGRASRRHRLSHQDCIRIGSTEIVFLDSAEERAAATLLSPREIYECLLGFLKQLPGPGRVDDLLDKLLDTALTIARADTGFIVLLVHGSARVHTLIIDHIFSFSSASTAARISTFRSPRARTRGPGGPPEDFPV